MKHIFQILILAIFSLSAVNCHADWLRRPHVEGYEMEFFFEGYPEERKIARQYHCDRFNVYTKNKTCILTEKDVGIGFYDIDEDGTKEIFTTINRLDELWCSYKIGCPLAILKMNKKGAKKPYVEIPWHELKYPGATFYDVSLGTGIKVLDNITNGYHDIAFLFPDGDPYKLWQWNGKEYEFIKRY